MRITIIGDQSILPKFQSKNIEDLKIDDIIDRLEIASYSDLIIVQKDGEIRVMKTRNFPYRQQIWDYEQIFRLLYVYMEQSHHINLRQAIIEMAKHLDPKEVTRLLVDLEKLGFEKS